MQILETRWLRWLRWSPLIALTLLAMACRPAPVANFSADVTIGRASLAVQFTDLSTGSLTAWRWDFGDGATSTEQNPRHEYTVAGIYQVILLATRDSDAEIEPEILTITVQPGPVDRVEILPNATELAVQTKQVFSVQALDAFGNEVQTFVTRWQADGEAGTIDQQGNFTASTEVGSYPASVAVEVIDGPVIRRNTASVTVFPGVLDRVELSTKSITMSAGEFHQFTALTYDQFGNQTTGADLLWKAAPNTGTISPTGRFSATKAGEHTDAILVTATQGNVTKSDQATVTVLPGPPFRVEVTPSRISAPLRTSRNLTATLFDQFGNEIPDPLLEWELSSGGTIFPSGRLNMGTKAGVFDVTVTASILEEEGAVKGTASLVIEPGPLDRVEVSARLATVVAGMAHQFTATAYDQFDNEIPDVTLRWQAREEAGRINSVGVFTASAESGLHADAVVVEAIEGDISRVERVTIDIVPGAPASIEVKPSPVTVVPGQKQVFTSTVFDLLGNEIPEAIVTWKVVRGGGTIDEAGVFTSGDDLGTYTETILVETDHEGAKATATVTVTIAEYLPGKILFNATIQGDTEIFIADPDGSNLTRLTFDKTTNHQAAWSPNGTKIVFTTWRDGNAEIYVMDADGTNQVRLTDNVAFDGWPSWSASGDRIAFTSTRIIGGFDIFVMDADGSNQTLLTENRRLDSDFRPYWSPDGTKILYSSDEGSEFDPEVWVMNADGTGKQRLTDNQATDVGVAWYPDGSSILFISDRDGQDDLDIYTMNSDGSNVVRLTFTPNISEELATFSPDGTKIIFINNADMQVWAMDANGQNAEPITEGMILSGYAQWQPIPETPVQPLVIGAYISLETDVEGPGDHFPTTTSHIPEEERHTKYTTTPPTSGVHWEQAAPWGVYASPIANERQVANLEAGDVIIQYNTSDEQLISQLEEFVRGQDEFPCHLVLAPNLAMPFTIVITAWGARDTMDSFDEGSLQEFIDFYRGNGPEAAECTP